MARKKKGGGSRGGSPWYLAIFTGLFALIMGAFMLLWRLLLNVLPGREWWAERWASPRFKLHCSVALASILFVVGLRLMRGHLEAQERYQLDPSRIALSTGGITWAEGESRALLESMVTIDLYQRLSHLPPSHAFDGDVLSAVAQKLSASPWVSSVDRIERRFPNESVSSSLNVSLSIRKPVVMVEASDVMYLVDRDCVVLPYAIALERTGESSSIDARIVAGLSPSVRRVVHADIGQRPTSGMPWTNEQIRAAVSVEAALRKHNADALMPIAHIDVADVGTKRAYNGVPYTPGRGVGLVPPKELSEAMIYWGKAPVHANGMEPSIEDKMTRLRVISDADPGLQQNPIYWLNTKTP